MTEIELLNVVDVVDEQEWYTRQEGGCKGGSRDGRELVRI